MSQPAQSEQPKRPETHVTLTALMNNIAVKTGHLNLVVETAFKNWLHTEGFPAFIEWLKGREDQR